MKQKRPFELLIIEGPRSSGKSTIVKWLVRLFGYKTAKFSRSDDPLGDMIDTIGEYQDIGGKWVFDRFHMTEYVMSTYHHRYENYFVLQQGIDNIVDSLMYNTASCRTVIVMTSQRQQYLRTAAREGEHGESEMPWSETLRLWRYASTVFGADAILRNESKLDLVRIIWALGRYNFKDFREIGGPQYDSYGHG